jgi:hypothetical protein
MRIRNCGKRFRAVVASDCDADQEPLTTAVKRGRVKAFSE